MAERITKARLACLPRFYRRLVLDGHSLTVENWDPRCPPRAVLWNLQGVADESPSVFRSRTRRQLPVVVNSEYWSDDFYDFLDGEVHGTLLLLPGIAASDGTGRKTRVRPSSSRRLDLRLADELFNFTPLRPYFDLWLGLADSWPIMRGIKRV